MSTDIYLSPPRRVSRPGGFLSIRSYLLLLIAATLVPMLALAGVLAWHYGVAARRTIEAERLDVANNLMYLIDREVVGLAGFLNGISVSPGLQAGDPRMVTLIGNFARDHGFAVLGLFDRTGHLTYTVPAGDAVKFASADQAGVPRILGGSKLFVSDLQLNDGAKPGLFFVSVPVMVDGQVAFVLSGGVPPQRLQGLFGESGAHQEWLAGIVDRTGVVLARGREPEVYVGHPAQQPMVDAARGSQAGGLFDVVSRSGVEVKNAFKRSEISGWVVSVAVPTSTVNAPLWAAAIVLTVIGLGLTLLSAAIGLLIASRIAHGVSQLGHAVVALASGDEVPLPTNTITELQDVLRVIEATAAMGHIQTPHQRH